MPESARAVRRRLSIEGPALAVALFAAVVAGGTIGYIVIEGWSVWDALYMTVTTIATVGFREVHPLSRRGEAFTMLLIVGGVATALYTFTLLATLIVEGGLQAAYGRRRRERMIDKLENHFIVCGYGRIGSIVVDELRRQKVPFVVIERSLERVQDVIDGGDLGVEADASSEEVLKRCRIDRARGLIAAVGTDAENVYAVLTARLLKPDLFIVGRAEAQEAVSRLHQAGADRVISPYEIGGIQMAQTALRPAVVDFVQLATSSGNLELMMEQVKITARSTLDGKSILDANLRQRFGVIVVAIKRADGRMEFNPSPDAVMRAGDDLVVLGRPETLKGLESTARQIAS